MSKSTSIASPDRRAWLRQAGSGILGSGLFGLGAATLVTRPVRAIATIDARIPSFTPEPAARELLAQFAVRAFGSATPSATQGPYYLPNMPIRSDIALGQTGLPMRLFYLVLDVNTNQPIPGAVVDLWQANACGTYSGFAQQGTAGQNWLRGVQTTDANGYCVFDTVFPGWYAGRTAHLHARVRPSLASTQILTTQFFFGELLGFPGFQINPAVYQYIAPYAGCGAPQTLNQNDPIFNPLLTQVAVLRPDGIFGLWAGLVILI